MGICFSCSVASVSPASQSDTAKVIYPDGGLREFDSPVSAGHALASEPSCFLCDADEMEFDGHVTTLAAEQQLSLGQLYFVLPRRMLNRRLQADEIAALAIRASTALAKASAGIRGRHGQGAVAPLVFPDVCKGEMAAKAVEVEMTKMAEWKGTRSKNVVGRGKGRGRGGSGSGGKSYKYKPDLTAIAE